MREFGLAEGERKIHKDFHSSFLRKKEKIVYLPIENGEVFIHCPNAQREIVVSKEWHSSNMVEGAMVLPKARRKVYWGRVLCGGVLSAVRGGEGILIVNN